MISPLPRYWNSPGSCSVILRLAGSSSTTNRLKKLAPRMPSRLRRGFSDLNDFAFAQVLEFAGFVQRHPAAGWIKLHDEPPEKARAQNAVPIAARLFRSE